MDLKFLDIHSHLNLSPLREKTEEVILRMREKGVGTIAIGVDLETSKEAIALAEKYDCIWAGVGLHPTDNDKEIFDVEEYKKLAAHPRVICIGECGLDYYRDAGAEMKEKQKETFKKHIALAVEIGKPLMIHARTSKGSQDAYEDAMEILRSSASHVRVNFHFFSGNVDTAKKILEIGGTMSFDGPITFARDYDEVIQFLPIESIMAKTDAPFAAPLPHRGKTCEPWMVEEVVKKIAEIKNMDFDQTRQKILENSLKFFHIAL